MSSDPLLTLSGLLRESRPSWNERELRVAVQKLQDVGIAAPKDLADLLLQDRGGQLLNDEFYRAGRKAFSSDTLRELRKCILRNFDTVELEAKLTRRQTQMTEDDAAMLFPSRILQDRATFASSSEMRLHTAPSVSSTRSFASGDECKLVGTCEIESDRLSTRSDRLSTLSDSTKRPASTHTPSRVREAIMSGAGANRLVRDWQHVLRSPLIFRVPHGSDIHVYANPSKHSPVVGRLQSGDIVQGYPAGAWFSIPSSSYGPVHTSPSDSFWVEAFQKSVSSGQEPEPSLTPQWSEVTVTTIDQPGVLQVQWPGLPVADVTYYIAYRLDQSQADAFQFLDEEVYGEASEPWLCFGAFSHGVRVQFHVEACMPPTDDDKPELRLAGPWSDFVEVSYGLAPFTELPFVSSTEAFEDSIDRVVDSNPYYPNMG